MSARAPDTAPGGPGAVAAELRYALPPASGRPRPFWTSAFLLLLAGVSFAVGAHLIGRAVPVPPDYGLADKLDYFAAHKDEYDAVYVGSSRVFRSFVPASVDAELERGGHPLRSLNLGIPGMVSFESDHIVRRICELEPERLRWIVLEPASWNPELIEGVAFSSRAVFWHTPQQTRAALDSVWKRRGPVRERCVLAWDHVAHMAWRMSNYGQGPALLRASGVGTQESYFSEQELTVQQGYQALEDRREAEYERRRQALLEDPREWQRRVSDLERDNARPGRGRKLEAYNLAATRRQIASIRAAGIEPVYVVPPTTVSMPVAFRLAENGHLPRFLSYSHPERYPELYRLDRFFDVNHLTREGADEFSRLFARDFGEQILAPVD